MIADLELASNGKIVMACICGAERYADHKADCPTIAAVNGGWQPIETAPEDGTRILLSNGDWVCEGHAVSSDIEDEKLLYHNQSGAVYQKVKRTDYWWSSTLDEGYAASHWRPLPKPPVI